MGISVGQQAKLGTQRFSGLALSLLKPPSFFKRKLCTSIGSAGDKLRCSITATKIKTAKTSAVSKENKISDTRIEEALALMQKSIQELKAIAENGLEVKISPQIFSARTPHKNNKVQNKKTDHGKKTSGPKRPAMGTLKFATKTVKTLDETSIGSPKEIKVEPTHIKLQRIKLHTVFDPKMAAVSSTKSLKTLKTKHRKQLVKKSNRGIIRSPVDIKVRSSAATSTSVESKHSNTERHRIATKTDAGSGITRYPTDKSAEHSYPTGAKAGIHTTHRMHTSSHASIRGIKRRQKGAPLSMGRDIFVYERPGPSVDARLIAIPARRGDTMVREYVYRSPRGDVFAGWEQRSSQAQMRPSPATYALPAPLSHIVQSGSVMGLGNAGGEILPDIESEEDALVAAIIEQLQQGPASLNADSPLAPGIHHALYFALLHAPLMDDRGARTIPAIYADAAEMLSIDMTIFARWEEFFRTDDMLAAIARDPKIFSRSLPPLGGGIRQKLEEFVGVQASRLFGGWNEINALTHDQEMVLQWLAVRLSNLDPETRIEDAASHISNLHRQNFKAATRLLAMIIKNSTLNETRPQSDAVVKRWNEKQVVRLMKRLMDHGLDDVVSHRSFRAHLTEGENKLINQGVPQSTLGWRYDHMRNTDIDNDARFNAELDRIDSDGELQDEAIRRMIESFQRMN